jgi:hypothetical protein
MEPLEEAEERRFAAVADAEAAGEAAVGGEAVPAPADKGRAGERGGLRREAEEDLSEEVVVFQRGRTGATAEAAHLEKQRLRRRAGAAAAAGFFFCLFVEDDAECAGRGECQRRRPKLGWSRKPIWVLINGKIINSHTPYIKKITTPTTEPSKDLVHMCSDLALKKLKFIFLSFKK